MAGQVLQLHHLPLEGDSGFKRHTCNVHFRHRCWGVSWDHQRIW